MIFDNSEEKKVIVLLVNAIEQMPLPNSLDTSHFMHLREKARKIADNTATRLDCLTLLLQQLAIDLEADISSLADICDGMQALSSPNADAGDG